LSNTEAWATSRRMSLPDAGLAMIPIVDIARSPKPGIPLTKGVNLAFDAA
jgi:hypothetical protein